MERYLKVKLDGKELDIDANADFPITFDYQLEDIQDFQSKKSSESLEINIPATLNNQRILNTFHNTSVVDNTATQYYKGIRKFTAEANGTEIFIGKAIPKRSHSQFGRPVSYELNAFGNNGDWLIDLKDVTLYDVLKHLKFLFTKTSIVESWDFDGRNENRPYVFAPIKYSGPLDYYSGKDDNYSVETMKPSLSKYWIIYWAFKSLGYKLKSNFFDSDFYRRQIMPWSWGNFLTSEGTKYDIHKFMAKSDKDYGFQGDMDDFIDLNVIDSPSPAFDNNNTVSNGDYEYDKPNKSMKWTYNTPDYGRLEVAFSLQFSFDFKVDVRSRVAMDVHWFKNGVELQYDHVFDRQSPLFGSLSDAGVKTFFMKTVVEHGDVIECKISQMIDKKPNSTVARNNLNVLQYQIDYFRVPVGGEVVFDSYLSLQKYKFLDFLKGEVDLFNLTFQTDPVNKEILIEPAHSFKIGNNQVPGYFNGNTKKWTDKMDISKKSTLDIFDDSSRELVFRFKDDGNDGALKIVQDRFKITLAAAKYVFDERFKAEKKVFENRFYSPTMHYLVDDFKSITGESPQMICMVPENISNTSASESENTFLPKTAYYKGVVSGVGGWKFDGEERTDYPFAFAVNYKSGGENDPILSYCDENIGQGGGVVGTGLLKRFFWQRLAIMNNGQWLTAHFDLNNTDVTNWYHRERIDIDSELFELIAIKSYNPMTDDSTQAILRKWVPVTEREELHTYPSKNSIRTNAVEVLVAPTVADENAIETVFDTQYNRLICLYNDIPRNIQ